MIGAAKSKRRAKPEAAGPSEGTADAASLKVRVVLDADNSIEPVYANYADVAQSQYDIEINFARVPAKLSVDTIRAVTGGEPLVIYPLVKVVLPKALLPGLVKALTTHIDLLAAEEGSLKLTQ